MNLGSKSLRCFIFAGHGFQYQGVNYLAPNGVTINNEADIPAKCFNIDALFQKLNDAPSNFVNVVVLDCCRHNPYEKTKTQPGLNKVNEKLFNAMHGTLILCGTKPGQIASEGKKHGFFTKHFVTALEDPTLELRDFKDRISQTMANDKDENVPEQRPSATAVGELSLTLHC